MFEFFLHLHSGPLSLNNTAAVWKDVSRRVPAVQHGPGSVLLSGLQTSVTSHGAVRRETLREGTSTVS